MTLSLSASTPLVWWFAAAFGVLLLNVIAQWSFWRLSFDAWVSQTHKWRMTAALLGSLSQYGLTSWFVWAFALRLFHQFTC